MATHRPKASTPQPVRPRATSTFCPVFFLDSTTGSGPSKTQVEYPGSYGLDIALAGDTTFAEEDEESLWWTVVSEGEKVRRPGIAVGKWLSMPRGRRETCRRFGCTSFEKKSAASRSFHPRFDGCCRS